MHRGSQGETENSELSCGLGREDQSRALPRPTRFGCGQSLAAERRFCRDAIDAEKIIRLRTVHHEGAASLHRRLSR